MKNLRFSLPNIITFINLSLGILAILYTVNNNVHDPKESVTMLIYASLIIIIAALTDRLDGKVARMLGATSELGKELDSLSDLISFGVAPVIIAWKLTLTNFDIFGYLLTIIFPIAGAYRLARYNTSIFDNVYRGVPITVAGAFLAVDNLYNCMYLLKNNLTSISPVSTNSIVTIILVIGLSILMVSTLKIKKV